jgi:hypothetical protein
VSPAIADQPAPPASAEPRTVPVTITFGRGSQRVIVHVGDSQIECRAPCTLDLPPGQATVGPTSGRWLGDVTFTVPEQPVEARLVRSRGRRLRLAGAILLGIGAAGLVPGLAVSAAASHEDNAEPSGAGIGISIPSGLAFLTGLVLLAVVPEAYEASITPVPLAQ